jgi:hypothetical protein
MISCDVSAVVFEAFDFDEPRGKISFDELVMKLLSVVVGCIISLTVSSGGSIYLGD